MTGSNKRIGALGVFVAGVLMAFTASGTPIPIGWTCVGSCGTSGADGVVTAPPNGDSSYQWVSTANGNAGVGGLPTGLLGGETNGSTLATSDFSATAGTDLSFYFNYVTSDGAEYTEYGWAALFDSSGNLAALLFTARTEPSGSVVPGQGMPAVNSSVTLNPSTVAINAGGPEWSPLGVDSGLCFDDGCGYTGWVNATYTIPAAGDYYLEIGVTNWLDTDYQTGLAMSGVEVGGKPVTPPIGVPEPAALGMFGLGVLLIGGFVALRRRQYRA